MSIKFLSDDLLRLIASFIIEPKYKLLDWRSKELPLVNQWISQTPTMDSAAKQLNMEMDEFCIWLSQTLVKSGAATIEDNCLVDKS